jgi:hypothetical protein
MNGEWSEAGRLIADARLALDRAHALTLEPTARNIEMAAGALGRAIGRIEALQICLTEQGPADAALLASARGLRDGIAGVALLLQHAAAYHANLLQSMMEAERASAPPALPARVGYHVQLHV